MVKGPASDPFSARRDPLERAADELVREFFISRLPQDIVHRQVGSRSEFDGGYALIAPHSSGARTLTVPAANEADFMFHGDPAEGGNGLVDFIVRTIEISEVDHLRLPLLTREEAVFLRERLSERLPDWFFAEALSSVSPVSTRKPVRLQESFRRAILRARGAGVVFGLEQKLNIAEVQRLHDLRWGAGSRGSSFFGMLALLADSTCAEYLTARDAEGVLLGAQLDILGFTTRHFYYSVSDRNGLAGLGTAVMGASWSRFVESAEQTEYSFGRGSERYKFRYADDYRIWFDLRGFYAPVRAAG